MRKSTKILFICAGVCIGVGLLLMGIAKAAGAKDCLVLSFENGIHFSTYNVNEFNSRKETYYAQDVDNFSDIRKLRIDTNIGDIEVRYGDEFKIECYSSERMDYGIQVVNGELELEMKEKLVVMFGLSFNWENHLGDVTVYLPRDMELERIKGDTKMGDVTVCVDCGEVDLNTSMGNVIIEGAQKRVKGKTSLGDIEWKVPGNYTSAMLRGNAETSLGSVTYNWEDMGTKMRLHGEEGRSEFDLETSLGDVDITFTK